MTSVKRGNVGENTAIKILVENGYKILKRNYRCKSGEIDIICNKKRILYFVEVKARWNLEKGYPEEAVTKKKLEHIRKSIFWYVKEKKVKTELFRILVVSILFTDNRVIYKLIPVD
ncbi:MAG TPA: YraN family protein [Patescibacteria group bacterium]|nr:YraN family protein [Patescibacteria group bacterium]